jgi:hypothetical protein
MVEIGDKVTIDCEMYCGPAYVRAWHERGAMVSIDRFGKEFFVLTRAIVELR